MTSSERSEEFPEKAPSLKLSSCLAGHTDPICAAVARYLAGRLQIEIEFLDDASWQTREQSLDAGEIDVCWMCGLPYTQKVDCLDPPLALLAAPVMRGERYQGRPIYFSDVIVHRDSAHRSFADLRGATWAYNEASSHSGHNLVRYHLATLDESEGYFGQAVESGAHRTSLEMVLGGQVDAAAIDSTVLEAELARRPEIAAQIRAVEVLGPSPIPPWVVSTGVPAGLRDTVRRLLMGMHTDPEGHSILADSQVARFVSVTDSDYDPIRHMAQKAQQVTLTR